jgi:hypothetical protein
LTRGWCVGAVIVTLIGDGCGALVATLAVAPCLEAWLPQPAAKTTSASPTPRRMRKG